MLILAKDGHLSTHLTNPSSCDVLDRKTTHGDVKTGLTVQDSHLCSTTRCLNDLPAAVQRKMSRRVDLK